MTDHLNRGTAMHRAMMESRPAPDGVSTEFREGWEACQAGRNRQTNPYAPKRMGITGPARRLEWAKGYAASAQADVDAAVAAGRNKAQPTPGPWFLSQDLDVCAILEGGAEVIIAEINPMRELNLATKDANARAITALPDLLAAAKLALSEAAFLTDGGHDAREALQDAIAKAAGQ